MFGAYLGLISKAQLYQGMAKYKVPEFRPRIKMFARAFISVLISGPLMLVALFVEIDNIWGQTALNTVGAFTFGMILFGFADEVNLRLALFDRLHVFRAVNGSTEI